jgi:hypothetical protein
MLNEFFMLLKTKQKSNNNTNKTIYIIFDNIIYINN